MGVGRFLLNFPNLLFGFSRCEAPGLRARGISRAVRPIRKLHVFTICSYMSSIRIGPPAVSTELVALAQGMERDWEISALGQKIALNNANEADNSSINQQEKHQQTPEK